jgi:hypothetical protein
MKLNLYIFSTAMLGLLAAVMSFFRATPSVMLSSDSLAWWLDFSGGLFFGFMLILLAVNIFLPLCLWRVRSVRLIIPVVLSVLSLLLYNYVDGNRVARSRLFLEDNGSIYQRLLTQVHAPQSSGFAETYSSRVERHFGACGRTSYLAPFGVHVYRDSDGSLYTFFLNHDLRGRRSGYMYAPNGKFHAGFRQTGWYWPVKSMSGWAYFETWYAEKQASDDGPNGGLPLIGLVFN